MADIDLQYLLDLADSYAPVLDYSIILDRTLKWEVMRATESLALARRELEEALYSVPTDEQRDLSNQTLADESPTAHIDAKVADREAKLIAAEEAARPKSLVGLFSRLTSEEFEGLKHRHTDKKGIENTDRLGDDLLTRCFLRVEAADGQDTGKDLEWFRALLDDGDLFELRRMIIGHHRIGSSVRGFDPRRSGLPATS